MMQEMEWTEQGNLTRLTDRHIHINFTTIMQASSSKNFFDYLEIYCTLTFSSFLVVNGDVSDTGIICDIFS